MKLEQNQVAVITGGASGIGFAMALAFAHKGMRLVLADIEPDALDLAVTTLKARGAEVIGVKTDVAKWTDVNQLAEAALDTYGEVHLLCNNAGVSILGPTWEMSLDDWRWVYDVNLWGVVHGIKAFVPAMRRQGTPAHVLNTASMAAFGPIGTHTPYCSTKAAVVSISECLNSELQFEGSVVGVSCLCPGMVDTQIHRSWRNRPEQDEAWSRRESEDAKWLQESAYVQGAGVAPETVAQRVVTGIERGDFWIFSTEGALDHVKQRMTPFFAGTNPPIVTAATAFDPKRWQQAAV